jgi:hypothetical protein
VLRLTIISCFPALPYQEGVADHDVLLGLSIVIVSSASDSLTILVFKDKSTLASNRTIKVFRLKEITLASLRLGVLNPYLLIRGCFVEGLEVLRQEGSDFS